MNYAPQTTDSSAAGYVSPYQQGLNNSQGIGGSVVIAPPNPSSPVSGSTITKGSPLNFPQSNPPDNGSGLVAGAVAGANVQPPQQQSSPTPNLDNASAPIGVTGDYTQDPSYQQAEQGLQGAQNAEATAINNQPSQAASLAQAQNDTGANAKLSTLNDVNTRLAQATADFNNASQNAETQGISSGTPSVYYQGVQAAIQRQKAVVVGGIAAEQQAAQGNYNAAEALAEKTAALKFSDAQTKIDNLGKFVAMNQNNVSQAEKVALSKIDAQQKQQQIALDQAKQAYTYSITYPQAGIKSTDNLATAAQKASSWLAQNPNAGSKPVVIGHHIDDYGNSVETYGLQAPNGQITPINFDSTQGNIDFGMSTGSILGLPSYNTQANNPGVNRPTRNNNPGNIKATANSINMSGVIGVESSPALDGGNFLIFASPQAGMTAIGQLLQSNTYKGMTAGEAIKKYNGGGAYGASDLGLDSNQDLQKQLQDPSVLQRVTQALATKEGFSTNAQQSGATGTTGSPTIDSSKPDYNTATVGKTGMTQATIDQNALAYALGDKSGVTTRTGKGQPQLQRTAILNRASEINSSGNFAANKEQLKALSSSLTEQTKYFNNVDRSLNNAENTFQQITSSFKDAGINPSDSTFLNTKVNDVNKFFGNNTTALKAFQAGVFELQNEYSQVFSRGGQRTLSGDQHTQDVMNGNFSVKDLTAIQDELQKTGAIVRNGSQDQVNKINEQINGILNPNKQTSNSSIPTGSPPAGQIWVKDKASGQYGSVPSNEYDSNKYDKLQ